MSDLQWTNAPTTRNVMVATRDGRETGFVVKGRHGWLWCAGCRAGSAKTREDAKAAVRHAEPLAPPPPDPSFPEPFAAVCAEVTP